MAFSATNQLRVSPLPRIRIDQLDRHIGERLRGLRLRADMSQERLGKLVGVSFQQIQKYESGTNRIAVSCLLKIARHFGVTVGYFYEDMEIEPELLEAPVVSAPERRAAPLQFARTAEGIKLLEAYLAIEDSSVRKRFVRLMRAVAGEAGEDQGIDQPEVRPN